MASAVATLGKDEVNDIIREEGKIEVTCEYVQLPCGSNGVDI
jgi:redox-regulated HSP33 family molecular chaperone